jgi:hypothetical protein
MAERVWRWYFRNAEAATIVAGVVTLANTCVLIGWGLAGIGVFALSTHPQIDSRRAILELVGVISVFYFPWAIIGIRTINGSRIALRFGTVLSALSLLHAVLFAAGLGPVMSFALMHDLRTDVYARLQLGTLLVLIATVTFVMHVIAVVPNVRRVASEPPASSA